MVHINVEKSLPAYLELKHMILLVDSLKDDIGLWSSKYSGSTIDLFVSSTIIWFTYEAHRSLGMINEINRSLKILEKTVIAVTSPEEMHPDKLLEILHCSTTILKYGSPSQEFINALQKIYLNKHKQLINIIRTCNPYIEYLPSLITINIVSVSKFSNELKSLLRDIVKEYIRALREEESKDITPPALYWVLEALLKLISLLKIEKSLYRKDEIIAISKHIESIIVNNLSTFIDTLEDIPLDVVLWYYHILEDFIELEKKLKIHTSSLIEKYHSSLIRHILRIGLIKWKETVYSKILNDIREAILNPQSIALEKGKYLKASTIDLITLSLLIGAYEKIGKYIVTYVTRYDLKYLKNIEKIALILGIAFLILGGSIATVLPQLITVLLQSIIILLQSLLQLILQGQLVSVSSPIFSILYLLTYISFIVNLLTSGFWIIYSLIRQEIKSWRDLIKRMIPLITFIRTVILKMTRFNIQN